MASPFVSEVGDKTFQKEVLESSTPVLVDFWATWCGPCVALAPVVEELAKSYQGKVKVVKFNVENDTDTPQKYGITSIPTLLIFKGGAVVQSVLGKQSKAKIEETLQRVI
jgi:thioredoxin 1